MRFSKFLTVGLLGLGLASPALSASLSDALVKLDEINALRESLASTLDPKRETISEETFKRVCAPVGLALKSWAQENGIEARQISDRFRNPLHEAKGRDLSILREFKKNPERTHVVEERIVAGVPGWQLYRRIVVRESCLHCHGHQGSRPEFIKSKYPQDKAHSFKAGDLRGLYSVWLKKD
ncbi:MAG: DUF3365 domain-containing protein [Bdellovibrionales bacterium]